MAKLKLEDGTEIEAFTEDEVREKIEMEVSGLKSKVEELLDEKKSVSQRARELEEAQREAEEERLKEKSQFKELYEKEQKAKAELQEQFESFQDRVRRQEISLSATEVVGQLTRDTARAELLAEKVAAFAKYTDEGVKYELGGVEVDAAKIAGHLKEKYPFLVDGSGASGGGATGGTNGGAGTKKFTEYTGEELKELRQQDPAEYQRIRDEFQQSQEPY